MSNSTVSGNAASGPTGSGGGISVHEGFVAGQFGPYRGQVDLTNSIVLGNTGAIAGAEEVSGEGDFVRIGGNILGGDLFDRAADVGDVTAAEVFVDTTEVAPGVFAGVLADNGGPTPTIAIRPDGPAAGTADPATATPTDQRGVARDNAPDLGAFEAEAEAEGGLTLVGGPKADVLAGGAGDDSIRGRVGNDTLRGLAGDDLLKGGKGRDEIDGGAGDDECVGGRGRDRIDGELGEDDLRGGRGRDRIDGNTGDDMLHGGRGQDIFIFGETFGADRIDDFDADPRRGPDRPANARDHGGVLHG